MRLCYYVECRNEFNDTCLKLLAFLEDKQTTEDLSKECISATKDLLMRVTSKQDKLANYERLKLTNCMDAGTTSPVESLNRVIKKGPSGVNSNMSLDKSVERTTKQCAKRIRTQHSKALRDMGHASLFSVSPTRDKIITKGQALADVNFDNRKKYSGKNIMILSKFAHQ